jgi:hypothetical protein
VKKIFRSFTYLLIGLFSLVVLVLVAIQIFQTLNDRKHGAVVRGVVLDQDSQPLSGVEVTLSPDYLNPAVPWWIPTDPLRGQVILSEKRANMIFAGEVTKMRFPSYFAGHYQTPPAVLAAMAGSSLSQDHYVPHSLAKNLAAPVVVLQQMKTNAAGWKVKEIDATIALPEDVKRFLTAPE